MTGGLQPAGRPAVLAPTQTPAQAAAAYLQAARAPNTGRAYRADWAHFTSWCARQGDAAAGYAPLPASPATVALYLAEHAPTLRVSTLVRRCSAIAAAHAAAAAGPSPTADVLVRTTMAGIRRVHGTAQHGKAPLVTAEVRRLLDQLPGGLLGDRDRALLLLGFASALRRSELVALDVGDVTVTGDGLVLTVRRSKTDQDGAGRRLGIPYGSNPDSCPVRATTTWTAALRAALEEWVGHPLDGDTFAGRSLFSPIDRHGRLTPRRLSDKAVALAVQKYAARAGLDPSRYAGHSLRAGFATAAAAAGASERSIMAQTGHKSLPMLRRYIREGSLFRDNAAAQLGL